MDPSGNTSATVLHQFGDKWRVKLQSQIQVSNKSYNFKQPNFSKANSLPLIWMWNDVDAFRLWAWQLPTRIWLLCPVLLLASTCVELPITWTLVSKWFINANEHFPVSVRFNFETNQCVKVAKSVFCLMPLATWLQIGLHQLLSVHPVFMPVIITSKRLTYSLALSSSPASDRESLRLHLLTRLKFQRLTWHSG